MPFLLGSEKPLLGRKEPNLDILTEVAVGCTMVVHSSSRIAHQEAFPFINVAFQSQTLHKILPSSCSGLPPVVVGASGIQRDRQVQSQQDGFYLRFEGCLGRRSAAVTQGQPSLVRDDDDAKAVVDGLSEPVWYGRVPPCPIVWIVCLEFSGLGLDESGVLGNISVCKAL